LVPEIVAIFSAMGWAGDSILVRLGLQKSNIVAAMFFSFFLSVILIGSYVLTFVPLDSFRSPAIAYFLVSGCLQPLIARALYYEGITRVGVSRAGPLRGVEPLFAAVIAVTVLQERPGLPVFVGTLLIVTSLWLITGGSGREKKWRLVDTVFPLGAALTSAISQTLRKQGLNLLPNPFIATLTVTLTSLALFFVVIGFTQRVHLLRVNRSGLLLFVGAACTATAAQVMNFIALGQGDVAVILPLLNTTPLFSVLFSSLFLRQFETVTARVIFGAAVMVAGVAIIATR
jgi:drug/metabolite transporter (DMT)-like permease